MVYVGDGAGLCCDGIEILIYLKLQGRVFEFKSVVYIGIEPRVPLSSGYEERDRGIEWFA